MTEKAIANESTTSSMTNTLKNIRENVQCPNTYNKIGTLTKSFVHAAPELSSSRKVPYVANN